MLIFHDDQHGTAIVTLAGLFNSLKFYGLDIKDIKIVMNGAGAAGHSIIKLLSTLGVSNVLVCDTKGIIYRDRGDLNFAKGRNSIAYQSGNRKGSLEDAVEGADVYRVSIATS